MSKSHPITLAVALLALTMVLSSSAMLVHAGVQANDVVLSPIYAPAVIGGQWAEYKMSETCVSNPPSLCQSHTGGTLDSTDFGALRVDTIVGSKVTLDLLTVYKNGTGSSQGVLVDVATGSSNFTALTTGPPADYFVLAGGLQAGDQIWNAANAPRLNGTVTETVLGSRRALNILNFTTSSSLNGFRLYSKNGFAWDQMSGMFVELSFDFSSSYYINGQTVSSQIGLVFGMVDNNIWASPGSSLPDFGIDAAPADLTVSPPGVSGNVTVNIVRIKGFSATVTLTVTTSSSAITCTLTPNKLYMGGPDTAKLSCQGSIGTYTVTVKGDSGYSTHTKTVTMNVVSTPPSSSTQPSNNIPMILIYAGIGAAAVIAATIAVLFLRKKEPEPMVAPSETPVPPPSPTQP